MDNYLIYLAQSYNKEALDILVDKYRNSAIAWMHKILNSRKYSKDIDIKLLVDEIDFTLYKIIETYDSSRGVFFTYLKGAIHNVIMNHLRTNHKNAYTLSLSQNIEDNILLEDAIEANNNLSIIKERFYAIEEVEDFLRKIEKLKVQDQQVILYKMQGYSVNEIVDILKTSVRNVNYITRKIKKQ